MDVDKCFDKRDSSMPKRRRDDDCGSNGASASKKRKRKGRGKRSGGGAGRGEGDLKKARGASETRDGDEGDDKDFEKGDACPSALGRDDNHHGLGKVSSNASTRIIASSASLALELRKEEDGDDSKFASSFTDKEFDNANVLQRAQLESSDVENAVPKQKPMPANAESNGESFLSQTR